jgi:hypothetical protein
MYSYNKGLFADWVPKPVQLLLIVLLLTSLLAVNGVYTVNIGYMVGSLGTQNSWIVFANYATIIGMGISLPLILRFKLRFRLKQTMVRTFLSLAILMMVIGTTDNSMVIVAASFFVGFFRMFALLELVFPLLFILSKDGNRPRFYSIFYPFAITIPQIVGYYVVKAGHYISWEHTYYAMAIIMLGCVILSVVFIHNQRFSHKLPLYYIDWFGMLLFGIVLMALAYFIAFARQLDYFNSKEIILSLIIFGLGTTAYLIHQEFEKRPFVNLKALSQYNVFHGIMLLFMLGFFLAGGSLQSSITMGVLGYDASWNNLLNLWMIPGIILAGIFGILWLAKGKSIKVYVMAGYTAFLFYNIMLYFLIDPNLEYQMLIVPNMIRGFGMVTLFIGVWYYTLNNLSMENTLSVVAFMLVVRSVIGPGFLSLIVNYVNDAWQLDALNNLALNMDSVEISKQAALGMYKTVRIQALIIGLRRILGALILLGGVILLYNAFHHFDGLTKRKIVIIRKRFKGHETSGYITENITTKDAVAATSAVF